MSNKQQKKRNNTQENKNQANTNNGQDNFAKDFSKIATTKISDALNNFNTITEEERKEKFGDTSFIDQFWEYFKENHANMLEEINSKEKITIYLQQLEKKGFSIENIQTNAKIYNEAFGEKEPEKTVITESLKSMKDYCDESGNKMPKDIFHDFAQETGFDIEPNIRLSKTSKIKKVTDIISLRKNYLEDKGIKLKDNQAEQTNKILKPDYIPAERLLITAAIKKIKKNLPNGLQEDFDEEFQTPLNINSSIQNLLDFKKRWQIFLSSHTDQIDKKLAKDLDKIIITNGDIYKEVKTEGIDIDLNTSFSEQSRDFKLVFNKLATRQLFEENQEKKEIIEKHIGNIADTFKGFPPYINELFKTYPYNSNKISDLDSGFTKSFEKQTNKILDIEDQIANGETDEKERSKLYKQLETEKENLKTIKRLGYANYIKSINPKLGSSIGTLIESDFDISLLSIENQQEILNTIIKDKLEDTIQNRVPDLLDIDKDEYKQFMLDIFDLNKNDITIPTRQGPLTIHFNQKSFLGGPLKHFMDISSKGELISEIKNFPLNFDIKINETNKDFFENSTIFESIFPTFNSKNQGKVKLNDGYKVRIKGSNGKFAEGYLSQTPPKKELEKETSNVGGWFLYSKPITRPEDDREIVCRENDKEKNNPVVIKDEEESFYNIDILSKDINLNGEGIGALIFGYVLGQHSLNQNLSPTNEKKLEEKFGKINTDNIYKDTIDNNPENNLNKENNKEDSLEKNPEKTGYQEFLGSRKDLKGFQNGNEKENFGFVEGAKIMIPMFDSDLPPSGGQFFATAEIKKIDEKSGKFILKFIGGGEQDLGKYEGLEKDFELNSKGLTKLTETFGYNLYKIPANAENEQNDLIEIIKKAEIVGNTDSSFKNVKRNSSKNQFTFISGENLDKEVLSFGSEEKLPGEKLEYDINHFVTYEYKYTPNQKKPYEITMYDNTKINEKGERKGETSTFKMDATNFVVFMASRKLQPQTTNNETKQKEAAKKEETSGVDTFKGKKFKGYSIASVLGFFSGVGKKLGDIAKKYEEGQTEELTDKIMGVGGLFQKLSGFMPTEKRKEAFEGVSEQYLTERSDKVWKKIDKYIKFYESDPDFGSSDLRGKNIDVYLSGKKKFKDEHQAPAMLLATIEKGKGPYSRNADWIGKGKWIKLILGSEHQARYLKMSEEIRKDIELHHNIYPQSWADDKQDELNKLEMRYIVDCIDGRELAGSDQGKLGAKYSKKFPGELETRYKKFYSQNNVKDKDDKFATASFDFARNEYFRLLADRPQQALGFLKTLGTKAITDTQRKVFEQGVMTGMLSGLFLNTVEHQTKSAIQKMCRTKGFLPGLRARHPHQQTKMAKLLDIATGGFTNEKGGKYNVSDFTLSSSQNLKKFCAWDGDFGKRLNTANKKTGKSNMDTISEFLKFTGKNHENKTLIELNSDETLPRDEKIIISEIYEKRNEKNEDPDPEIKQNGSALTNGVFTKNQSIVEDLVEIQNNTFKAKDKDERGNIESFWNEVTAKLPKGKNIPKSEVKFFFNIFLNRFERFGFSEGNKEDFARRLATVKKEIDKGNIESGKNILRYSIVGEVLSNAGNTMPPRQLTGALEGFMSFINNNLNTILEPEVIEKTLGNSYIKDIQNPYEVGNREDYVELEEIKGEAGFSPEEKENRKKLKQQYARGSEKYINKNIYEIARKLDKGNWKIKNKFKKDFNIEEKKKSKSDTKSDLNNILGAKSIKIRNKDTIKKIEKALLGKNINSDDDDDYEEEDDDDYE